MSHNRVAQSTAFALDEVAGALTRARGPRNLRSSNGRQLTYQPSAPETLDEDDWTQGEVPDAPAKSEPAERLEPRGTSSHIGDPLVDHTDRLEQIQIDNLRVTLNGPGTAGGGDPGGPSSPYYSPG